MPVLNEANKIYSGTNLASKVYAGSNLVWPAGSSTDAWVNAVIAAGGTVSASRKTLVSDLIEGLKTDGVWIKLDRLWVMAAENSQSALIDLVALAQATPVNSPTFSVDQGYRCNTGASQNIDTNYNLSTGTVHYLQDSAHIADWSYNNVAQSDPVLTTGAGNIPTALMPRLAGDGNFYGRVNDYYGSGYLVSVADASGFFVINRSADWNKQAYRNGVFLGEYSGSSYGSSAPPVNNTLLIYAGKHSAVSAGGSMNASEYLAFYNRLLTYMTAIGVIVDPATAAWSDAVEVAGGTVSTSRRLLVDNLIKGLKTDGVWARLDRLWLMAGENTQSALIDIVALAQATPTNFPPFTVDRGYSVDGTKIVELNYTPTVNGVNFLEWGQGHVGVWNLYNGAQPYQLISDYPGASLHIYPMYSGGTTYTRINDAAGSVPISDSRGWIVGDRPDGNGRNTFYNGALLGYVAAGLYEATMTRPIIQFYNGPAAAISIGGTLTAAQHSALYRRLYDYNYALGITDEADPQVWAWKLAVTAAGGTISPGRLTLVRNLIAGLKADGVWAKLDRLFILAAENEQSALIPLTGGSAGKNVSSAAFTVDRGYSFPSGGYVDFVYVPSTHGVRLTLNSAHLGAWNLMEGGTSYGMVQTGAAGLFAIFPAHYYDGQNYMRINDTLSGPNPTIGPVHTGFLLGNRTGASVTEAYQNGILKNTQSTASESVATGGLVAADNQCAMASVGGSLTATEQLAFYNRLRTYMTAVGVP
jgi:hypothetical protein